MEPIAKLLKSKANNGDCNPALRGALRSAIAGRQHPQARVFAAGWAEHNKCLFCLHKLADLGSNASRRVRLRGKTRPQLHRGVIISDDVRQETVPGDASTDLEATRRNKMQHKVEAIAEQVASAPVGNLGHRIWRCQVEWMSKLRSKWASPHDLAVVQQLQHRGSSHVGEGTAGEAVQAYEAGCEGGDLQVDDRAAGRHDRGHGIH